MWRKKVRPQGWYKSGKSLFYIWLGGTVILSTLALSVIYPHYLKARSLQDEMEQARAYMDRHEKILDPEYEPPPQPTPEELAGLQEQLPVETEPDRLLVQLRKAVESSGAEWVELRTAEKPEGLPRLPVTEEEKEKEEEKEEKKEADESERNEDLQAEERQESDQEEDPSLEKEIREMLPADESRYRRVWVDLYVQGTDEQAKELLDRISRLSRTVSVVEWNLFGEHRRPNVRIRFVAFVYRDGKLKNLTGEKEDVPAANDSAEERQ
ncbi:hypothetical protein [Paludifilum halophilum]|uniref:Uncharacterized protein n=1 Tax=Paludifilum halophilum TaxID=1642702 RepID=A0A235B1M2_9BACL|nr:hypothetical protein [Paludifilum halophilum]OYD06206.1 hypothetical protein CHM34_17590 [Paludifilum halophilum]